MSERSRRRQEQREAEAFRATVDTLTAEALKRAQKIEGTRVEEDAKMRGGDQDAVLRAVAKDAIAERFISGWQVLVSVRIYGDGEQHWHLSCMLWPKGRSSTQDDWARLGRISSAAGAPREPITDIEKSHPNAPIHWVWFVKTG